MAAIFINITREKLYKKYHMEGFTMQRFTLPRDLYHGKGALEALKSFEGKKAIICVGGGSMKRFGFLDKAEAYLKEAGMEVNEVDKAAFAEQLSADIAADVLRRGDEIDFFALSDYFAV